jgi:hypothetical protein
MIISPDDNFAGATAYSVENPVLPHVLPFINKLRQSQNASEILYACFGYVRYYGLHPNNNFMDGEEQTDEGGHGTWAGYIRSSESLMQIIWMNVKLSLCIS